VKKLFPIVTNSSYKYKKGYFALLQRTRLKTVMFTPCHESTWLKRTGYMKLQMQGSFFFLKTKVRTDLIHLLKTLREEQRKQESEKQQYFGKLQILRPRYSVFHSITWRSHPKKIPQLCRILANAPLPCLCTHDIPNELLNGLPWQTQ